MIFSNDFALPCLKTCQTPTLLANQTKPNFNGKTTDAKPAPAFPPDGRRWAHVSGGGAYPGGRYTGPPAGPLSGPDPAPGEQGGRGT